MALTQKELDSMKCSCGDDAIIYFHSSCHMKSPTWCSYDKETGMLTIECAECKKTITMIEVAK